LTEANECEIDVQAQVMIAKNDDTPATGTEFTSPYLTKDQIAQVLGVTRRTVENWMNQRLLPHLKLGRTVRFDLEDVRRHLNEHCRCAGRR
jgi:excisionase family DNA binding protein